MKVNFLNRIVEKALGAASPIEPRLPSLFEPMPGVDVMPAFDTDRQDSPTSEGQQSTAAHEATPASKNTPYTPEARTRSGNETKVAHSVQARPLDEPPQAPVAQELRVAKASLVPGNAGPQQTDRAMPNPASHAILNRTDQQEDSVVRQIESVSPMPPALLPTRTPIIFRVDDDAHPAREIVPDEPGQVAHRTQKEIEKGVLVPDQMPSLLPPRTTMVAPNIPPRNSYDATHGELTKEQQTPVINVTIGRVEVRAVQGSPSRPRAESSKPKPLSLDDYLKQQGGRR